MSLNNPTHAITLFCWFLDVSGNPFPVDIEDRRTVGHLKEIMKEKPNTDLLISGTYVAFLPFDQVVLTTLSQGIPRDRKGSKEQNKQASVSRRRTAARGTSFLQTLCRSIRRGDPSYCRPSSGSW